MRPSERVIVTHHAGLPRATRMERIIDCALERLTPGGGLALVANLDTGAKLVVAQDLDAIHVKALWDELLYWMSGRGGGVFDVDRWQAMLVQLASAGLRDRGRSIPPRPRAPRARRVAVGARR